MESGTVVQRGGLKGGVGAMWFRILVGYLAAVLLSSLTFLTWAWRYAGTKRRRGSLECQDAREVKHANDGCRSHERWVRR